MRKWLLNFIEITIFVVILLVCCATVLQSTILKDKTIMGYKSYVIASNSMYPVLEYGDVIIIKEVDYQDIQEKDIVTYLGKEGEFKDRVITHEVIEVFYENGTKVLKTKGRANTGTDPNVYEEQIYGRFIYRFFTLSFISKIVRDELGFVLFIFIPFTILFILEFINMVKETRRRELEKQVKQQLEELKKIDTKTNETKVLEETMCLQLEQINEAKRDFKKMNELEKTVKLPLKDIADKITTLKEKKVQKQHKNTKESDKYLEETMILFDTEDIKKEIAKEIKEKEKLTKKTNKKKSKKTKKDKTIKK